MTVKIACTMGISTKSYKRLKEIGARSGIEDPIDVIRAAIDVYDEFTLGLQKALPKMLPAPKGRKKAKR